MDVVNGGADDVALVVGGDYHLTGERWQVRAFVQSVPASRAIGTVTCVEAPKERPWEAASSIAAAGMTSRRARTAAAPSSGASAGRGRHRKD